MIFFLRLPFHQIHCVYTLIYLLINVYSFIGSDLLQLANNATIYYWYSFLCPMWTFAYCLRNLWISRQNIIIYIPVVYAMVLYDMRNGNIIVSIILCKKYYIMCRVNDINGHNGSYLYLGKKTVHHVLSHLEVEIYYFFSVRKKIMVQLL